MAGPQARVRRRFKADPIAITSVAISIVTTVILGTQKSISAIDAAIVGLLIITIGIALEIRYSEERRHQLEALLDSADWLRPSLTGLASVISEISRDAESDVLLEEARRRIQSFEVEMEQLRRGTIARVGSDATDLLRGIAECRSTCNAVTYLAPGTDRSASWWAREVGRTYWEANLAAIAERHARITRVFIVDEMTDEIRAVLEEQGRAGVDVRFVLSSHLPGAEHNNFVVFDERHAWEARMNAHGEIVENYFHLGRSDIQRLTRSFGVCLANSTRFTVVGTT
jgi:hypothetical protein